MRWMHLILVPALAVGLSGCGDDNPDTPTGTTGNTGTAAVPDVAEIGKPVKAFQLTDLDGQAFDSSKPGFTREQAQAAVDAAAKDNELGSEERAHFYKWLVFLTNTVQAEVMTFHYPEDHTDDLGQVEAVRRIAAERTTKAWQILDGNLGPGPFVLGSHHSACDTYLFMLALWSRKLPTTPASLPRIRACLDATAARPALQRAFATEGMDPSAVFSTN